MFSFISMNWRGKPLVTYRTVVELIAATTTKSGLRIQADVDTGSYPIGIKVTDKELAAIPIRRHEWHPDWNYSLPTPRPLNRSLYCPTGPNTYFYLNIHGN